MAVKLLYDRAGGELTVSVTMHLDSLENEAKRKVKGSDTRKKWVQQEALAEAQKRIQESHASVQNTKEKVEESVKQQQAQLAAQCVELQRTLTERQQQLAEQAADVLAARPEIIGE